MTYSQPGIFNALDYGMSPANSGGANAIALQDTINAAQVSANTVGAIVLIPSFDATPNYGAYLIDVSVLPGETITISAGSTAGDSLLICGTGIGTTLQVVAGGGTLFSVLSSMTNSKYVTFQDLTIRYIIVDGFGGIGTGFLFQTEGNSLFRVNITNCQTAVEIGNGGTFTTLRQCNISYDSFYPAGQACTGIDIQGGPAQINIEQCSVNNAVANSSSTGISVDYSYYVRVTDTAISGFNTGLLIQNTDGSGQTRGATFAGLDIDATGSCIHIKPTVNDVSFVNCVCQPTSGSSPTTSGILLSIGSGGSMSEVDNIRFASCIVAGYAGGTPGSVYGLQIGGGQNIQVNGGSYSGNGTAGIAITAATGFASEIQISGANCIGPSYAGGPTATTQLYGIYVSGGQDIQIIGANCSGNGVSSTDEGAGIYIDGSTNVVQDVRIVGAICSGPTLVGSTSVQQYGIYVNRASGLIIDGCTLMTNTAYGAYLSSVQDVTIIACDLYSTVSGALGVNVSGTTAHPTQYVFIRNCNGAPWTNRASFLLVSGSVSNLEITNCSGYNDTKAELASTTSPPTVPFSGLTYSYYGPTAFYISSTSISTVIAINGFSTHLNQGGFTLGPGDTATVTGSTTHYLMLGK